MSDLEKYQDYMGGNSDMTKFSAGVAYLVFFFRNGETISIVGDGYAPDENEPAKLLVKFSEGLFYFYNY